MTYFELAFAVISTFSSSTASKEIDLYLVASLSFFPCSIFVLFYIKLFNVLIVICKVEPFSEYSR